jgi:ribose-phosphate pyrophosphokinase
MSAIVLGFGESMAAAVRLAEHLGIAAAPVEVHRFPDRECLVRVPASDRTVILYRSLDNPDAKLIELLFAAAAARDLGAARVILVAPYLAYMRQDRAFRPGEAVSQHVIGKLLADHFDALVTVDPHLHRTSNLSEVAPGIPAVAVSAAPALAELIDRNQRPLIVGPDSESRQWTESIAGPLGLDMLVGTKERHDDRSVSLTIDGAAAARGRPVVLVDDLVSSGNTLIETAHILLAAGAISVEAIVTHCLASDTDLALMTTSGIARISGSDSIDNRTGRAHLAPLLAEALQSEQLLSSP